MSRYDLITRPMPEVIEYLQPRIIEEGDCWIWQQQLDRNGMPKATIGLQYSVNVRRWILTCKRGELGKRVASTTCGVRGCVNPDHLIVMTVGDAIRAAAKRGAHSQPGAVANRTKARRKTAKLVGRRDEVLEMRQQGLSYAAIAEIMGVNKSAIGHVCRGRFHLPLLAGASVFTFRP